MTVLLLCLQNKLSVVEEETDDSRTVVSMKRIPWCREFTDGEVEEWIEYYNIAKFRSVLITISM